MADMQVSILTPGRRVYDGRAEKIVFPAIDGELCILPLHAPLIAALGRGELRLTGAEGTTQRYVVEEGLAHVDDDVVTILAGSAVAASEIDVEAAKKRIEETKKTRPSTIEGWDEYRKTIERNELLVHVAEAK